MVDFIVLFLLGAISAGSVIFFQKKYIKWKDHRENERRYRAQSEKDGWIKTNLDFVPWSDRARMNKWHRKMKEELELCIWLKENTTGSFKTDWINGNRYIMFANDEDGMAFKLRWL